MMQNQTMATHLVREIQVQHTLPLTLPTTTMLASTTTVSFTPLFFSLFALVSQLEYFSWLPLTVNFFPSFLPHRCFGLFLPKFPLASQPVHDRTYILS